LDNLNYDNSHGGGGFSHPYVIIHKYFVKKPNGKKGIILLTALLEWILEPSKNLYLTFFNQMHYMNIFKHKCMH